MNEDELRGLVRAAVEKHLGSASPASARAVPGDALRDGPVLLSFGQYRLERAPDDNMCLIEPDVRCNHCGFCKCHGH